MVRAWGQQVNYCNMSTRWLRLPIASLSSLNPPARPRYPIAFTLFEDTYPELSDKRVNEAMSVMDNGYLAQQYYARANYKIPLQGEREETFTFENYGWTEHMCRKWGQWFSSPDDLLVQFEKRGFCVTKT